MASGPYFDKRRGTYTVQWFDGRRWTRTTVCRAAGWKPGQPRPRKDPPEALAAVKEFSDREKQARSREPSDPRRTVAEFLADYRVAYERSQAQGSLRQLDQVVRTFTDWCGRAKVVRLDDVNPAACQRFLDDRAGAMSRKTGQPIAPRRLAQERALLSGAWKRAAKLGEIPANPWTPTAAPGWDKERRRRRHHPSWTPDEFARLYQAARPWLRDILTLGVQTGIRVSALLSLEWRDVHWANDEGKGFGEIEVRPEWDKGGKGYRVPISAKCHDLLMRRQADRRSRSDRLLTGQAGKPTRMTTTATGIIRACHRAGLPEPKSPNHHMRRTFGRWAVLGHLTGRPIPLYVVSRWMGHSSVQITEDYLDVRSDEGQDWMAEFKPGRAAQAPGVRNDSRGQ
jgi:integrase